VLHLLIEYRVPAQTVAIVLVAAAALRWGAGPERATAGVLLWLRLGDIAYHAVFQRALDLTDIDLAHFVIDGVACAAIFTVAVFANRMYTLWFAAFQFLAVSAHLSREMAVEILPTVYAIMFIAPSYFQIGLLAGGTWFHVRRRRRHGPYRSWRHSSNLSQGSIPSRWPSG
jgi:hypothetical protein